jgi:hypothetical protein
MAGVSDSCHRSSSRLIFWQRFLLHHNLLFIPISHHIPMRNTNTWKIEFSDRCNIRGESSKVSPSQRSSRALVFREVAAGKIHQDPLTNDGTEDMIPNGIKIKLEEATKLFPKDSIRVSPAPREKTHPIEIPEIPKVGQLFAKTSNSGVPQRVEEKRESSEGTDTLFTLSDQSDSNLNLDDFIYEENPFEKNLHSSKRLKTVHFQLPRETPSGPFPNPEKPIENPFSSAFDKLQSSIPSGVMDSSLSVSPSILSLLEDDTEAW